MAESERRQPVHKPARSEERPELMPIPPAFLKRASKFENPKSATAVRVEDETF